MLTLPIGDRVISKDAWHSLLAPGIYTVAHDPNITGNQPETFNIGKYGKGISDVERLRAPMQKVTNFMLKCMGVKPSAEIVTLPNETNPIQKHLYA